MHRPTKRLTRMLVTAATVPAVLVVAGCSSDSGSDSSDGAKESSSKASASAAQEAAKKKVEPAKYAALPQACSALSKKTLADLVPKGDSKAGSSDDESARASCSWSSLDNNGVKGSQYRWLNVSMVRFDSDVNRGSGADLASDYYAKQVEDAQGTDGAKGVKTSAVKETGDEATLVAYDRSYKDKKKDVTSRQQTVVTRVDNVVVTVDFNGSGLAGDKTPDAGDLSKDAEKAAQEVVASVRAAGGAGAGDASASASPSKSADGKSDSKDGGKDDGKSDAEAKSKN
ncbi:DUF3558 domain-containing protein [Streptomyces sp. SID5785]|uniref:DUF3558 domain-containing protein n=1 Tax=Streptomyces sp. SID5785 TaxID=2690309 RepID=UPI001360F0BC|nr:DUF3558 domain-containing protein [Streptomyces sp. SID5785]MZD05626.1 DUF3558 domain-containing protein [Streptomyces sp. SID5785]